MSTQTPSQTVGPFFSYGLLPEEYGYSYNTIIGNRLASTDTPGDHIHVFGQVLDADAVPIEDALIEIWQPDSSGQFATSAKAGFSGFGRAGTDNQGFFEFHTIKPGAVAPGMAPSIAVIVFMRGQLSHSFTRIYFADEEPANVADPGLLLVPQERRETLIAEKSQKRAGGISYRFDIRMQGEQETVFFDM